MPLIDNILHQVSVFFESYNLKLFIGNEKNNIHQFFCNSNLTKIFLARYFIYEIPQGDMRILHKYGRKHSTINDHII